VKPIEKMTNKIKLGEVIYVDKRNLKYEKNTNNNIDQVYKM